MRSGTTFTSTSEATPVRRPIGPTRDRERREPDPRGSGRRGSPAPRPRARGPRAPPRSGAGGTSCSAIPCTRRRSRQSAPAVQGGAAEAPALLALEPGQDLDGRPRCRRPRARPRRRPERTAPSRSGSKSARAALLSTATMRPWARSVIESFPLLGKGDEAPLPARGELVLTRILRAIALDHIADLDLDRHRGQLVLPRRKRARRRRG